MKRKWSTTSQCGASKLVPDSFGFVLYGLAVKKTSLKSHPACNCTLSTQHVIASWSGKVELVPLYAIKAAKERYKAEFSILKARFSYLGVYWSPPSFLFWSQVFLVCCFDCLFELCFKVGEKFVLVRGFDPGTTGLPLQLLYQLS